MVVDCVDKPPSAGVNPVISLEDVGGGSRVAWMNLYGWTAFRWISAGIRLDRAFCDLLV